MLTAGLGRIVVPTLLGGECQDMTVAIERIGD